MNDGRPVPTSLKVVAGLFTAAGISALVEIIVSLVRGHVSINLGVVALLIGPGLLRLSKTWRRWALFFTWATMISAALCVALFLGAPGALGFKLFGQRVGEAPKGLAIALAVATFLLALWQYWVLTRPDVRELFRSSTEF